MTFKNQIAQFYLIFARLETLKHKIPMKQYTCVIQSE